METPGFLGDNGIKALPLHTIGCIRAIESKPSLKNDTRNKRETVAEHETKLPHNSVAGTLGNDCVAERGSVVC